jgi:hypothetical protein
VLLETDVAPECYSTLCGLLHRLRAGAKALSYLDLRKIWGPLHMPFPYNQVNKTIHQILLDVPTYKY